MDAFATATEMLEALRTRRVTAQELLDLHLRRIERYNPRLNAIVIPNTAARQAAIAADAARARGEAQALLGLPLTMKDCLYVAGLPTTGGVPPESLADLRDYYKLYLAIFWAINATGMPAAVRHHEATRYRATGDEFLAAYANGLTASAADYIIWHGQREQYRAAYRAFFREWDVLLAPANIVNAFPHIDVPMPTRTLDVNGQAVAYDLQCVYPALANLTGQPATAFPVGLTRAGLPIGLQAIGPYREDRTPMRFTTLVAQEYGGFRPPPGYETD